MISKKATNILKVAFRALSRNKLRSLLTALGIIIGVACVVAVVGIGEGARIQAENQLKSLGTNFLMVLPGSVTSSGARAGFGASSKLSEDDVDAIRREVSTVSYVSASIRTVAQVIYGNQNWSTSIQGAQVDWPLVRSWNVDTGQFFTDQDDHAAAKVCVLGKTVVANLFGDEDPDRQANPDQEHSVPGRRRPRSQGRVGRRARTRTTSSWRRTRRSARSSWGRRPSARSSSRPRRTISWTARRTRSPRFCGSGTGSPARQDDDFIIRSQTEMIQQAEAQNRTMSALLWSIAGVSLLVGGIGIMNIMLVSVTERTREIGVRMAIGAKGRDIQAQFLVEAVALAVTGGAVGVAGGLGIQRLVARLAGWPVAIQPQAIVLAVVFSALVGVGFGFYPALKASRLDPIEALRYE